jgi:hypothetical protein
MRVISVISRAILASAVWGFLSLGGAYAGTCVNRRDGTDTVQSCDNGSYTVTNRHGRRGIVTLLKEEHENSTPRTLSSDGGGLAPYVHRLGSKDAVCAC